MAAPRLSLAYPRLWRPNAVPTFPVTLDKSHPLARGLALSIVPGSSRGAVDFVNDLAPVVTGAGYVAAGARGPGYTPNTTGVLGYKQAVAPPVFSMEVLVQSGTPGTRNEFICGWDSAAGAGGGLNDRSITGFGAGVTGSFEGYIFPGSAVTVVGGTTFFAGLISHVVLTSDGTTLALYVNGVSVASTAAGSGYAGYSNPSYFVVGGTDRTGWWWSGTIQLANLATVAWTAAEIAARYAEPFGMFRPIVRRTYYVAPAAGGGGFSASLSDSITTSDALSSIFAAVAAQTDSVATATSFTGAAAGSATLSDTAAATDATTGLGTATTTVSDSVATSDASTAAMAATASVSDTTASSDTRAGAGAFSGAATDSTATSDILTAIATITATLSDSTATSDAYSTGTSYVATVSDTLTTSSTFTATGAFSVSIADTAATSDAYVAVAQFAGSLADIAAISDASSGFGHGAGSLSDSAVTSDAFVIPSGNSLSDLIATADVYFAVGAFRAVLSDSLLTSDSYSAGSPTFTPDPRRTIFSPTGGRSITSSAGSRRITSTTGSRAIGS